MRKSLNARNARTGGRGVQLGVTLLEIMIVLAILAVVMGIVIGPKVIAMFQESKVKTTRMQVEQLAHSTYPHWVLNTGRRCPSSVGELARFAGKKRSQHAWKNDLIILCGNEAPPEAQGGFGILSLGPDGRRGTADDIASW